MSLCVHWCYLNQYQHPDTYMCVYIYQWERIKKQIDDSTIFFTSKDSIGRELTISSILKYPEKQKYVNKLQQNIFIISYQY